MDAPWRTEACFSFQIRKLAFINQSGSMLPHSESASRKIMTALPSLDCGGLTPLWIEAPIMERGGCGQIQSSVKPEHSKAAVPREERGRRLTTEDGERGGFHHEEGGTV